MKRKLWAVGRIESGGVVVLVPPAWWWKVKPAS